MIHIQKCPRLGEHGWSAHVTWNRQEIDILLVGAHQDILDSAHRAERALRTLEADKTRPLEALTA
jgi:hypothetical protein